MFKWHHLEVIFVSVLQLTINNKLNQSKLKKIWHIITCSLAQPAVERICECMKSVLGVRYCKFP